jgi:hypothetical protein
MRRASSIAPMAAAAFSDAAANALPRTPSKGISTNAGSSAPTIAPAVFAAYRRAPAPPKSAREGASTRSIAGRVPPIATAGAPTSANGKPHANGPTCRCNPAKASAAWASAHVAPTPSTSVAISSDAYNSHGRALRSASLPNSHPPSARPAKNALIATLTACTSTPTTSVNCLTHNT